MFLTHLSLAHFRNYHSLELDLTQRLTLMQGDNAQGKTNLLEAIYFLATSKPVHAQTEREVVDWQAQQEPIPYSRVTGLVRSESGSQERPLELEIILSPRSDGINFTKQVKINGVGKRSLDLVGLMRAVLFLPEDIELVAGSPSARRRYLDVALCQIDPVYCRALSAYQKVLTQRNSLLKALRDENVGLNDSGEQLEFWDDKLVQHGGLVMARRHGFIVQLQTLAQERHAELSAGKENLCLQYVPSFNYVAMPEAEFERLRQGSLVGPLPGSPVVSASEVTERFRRKLIGRRSRELNAGATLYGPHRDELRFLANDHDLHIYGSRGQQRTAALSLKLAEVRAMTTATGAAPLLLLDDVMSELDAQRRRTLLAALDRVEQAIITTTDWEDFTPQFRDEAELLQVRDGGVHRVMRNS